MNQIYVLNTPLLVVNLWLSVPDEYRVNTLECNVDSIKNSGISVYNLYDIQVTYF